MALGFKRPIKPDDPRLRGHETDYQSSRGGWLKTAKKPVPGTKEGATHDEIAAEMSGQRRA